jgi:hypothetical protein
MGTATVPFVVSSGQSRTATQGAVETPIGPSARAPAPSQQSDHRRHANAVRNRAPMPQSPGRCLCRAALLSRVKSRKEIEFGVKVVDTRRIADG